MKKDWVECTLGEIVIYSKGKKPKVLSKEKTKDLNIPYINIKAFEKSIYDEYTDGFKCNLCNDGDLLMVWDGARSGLTGRAKKGAVGSTLMKIEPSSSFINKEYLYYFLSSKYVLLNTNPRGVGIPHVEPNLLWNSKFIIHNLPIQRAIVAKIEELFSSLDSGIADLTKAQKQLVIYRQAVLKKAFEGELTNNSEEVNVVKLGAVIEKPRYGTSKKCTTVVHGKAVLRIPNIRNGVISTEELKYAEFEETEISTLALKEGDILTIRSNGSVDLVGKCAMINKKDEDYLFAGYLIRLRPNPEKIFSKYLLHCLSSHNLRIQIESKAKSTSGVNNINSGELESLEIPLFSLKQQHQIIREIESRLSVCDKVEESISESLEKAKALRQSILKKAFEGKLLSEEEIAKCKQEKDYEPAYKLLERIKGEKKKKK